MTKQVKVKIAKAQVMVVSGVTAGGKTTLIRALNEALPGSLVLSFDDYSIDALPSAPPIDTPVKEAVNQYDIQQLMADFFQVRETAPIILIDFPFGYTHQVLAPYIEWAIYVKTPLDICLARQILRDYSNNPAEEIRQYLQTYLTFIRPIIVDHEAFVSAHVDFLVDGTLAIEQQVAIVLESIKKG